MSAPEGWDGLSIVQHVQAAKNLADEGISLAQNNLDEIEILKAVVGEKPDQILVAEVERLARSANDNLKSLKSEMAMISTFNAPGTTATMPQARRMTSDKLAAQAESLGTLSYEALSDFCLKSVGDEYSQRQFAESVGFGINAFCRSIAMQIRGSFGSDWGGGNE